MSSDSQAGVDPIPSSIPAAPAPHVAGASGDQPASAAGEDSTTPQSGEASGSDSRDKTRFKIGSQRPGAVVPRIEPRVQIRSVQPPAAAEVAASAAPAHSVSAASATSATPTSNTPTIATPASGAAAATSASTSAGAATASVSPQLAAATSDDVSATASISDSAQQPDAAASAAADVAATAETAAPKPFVGKRKQNFERIPVGRIDVPNVRAQLPPELQAEMDEALGDMSLDDLVAADSPAPLPVADNIEPETKVKAKVVSVHRDNVFFEIGARNQGVVPLKNFAEPPAPGTVLEAVVARFNPLDGLYELGLMSAAVDVADWSQVHDGMVVEARVTGHNKGGLECEVNKLRGFIPASQISMYRVEDLSSMVGQKFACVVTEANPERRNLVLSRRGVLEREQAEAKEKLWGELAVGQVREGTVRSLRDFGAFVDIGGVDGMLHVSQLSWDRIKHPSDVLEVGQKIKVKIQKIDAESHKISLAFRDLAENPWDTVSSKYQVGMGVQGKVSRIMDFGAFIKLEPGIEGMVHISELAWSRVFRVGDILSEGQTIEAKVTSVDRENQRIGLSIKALIAKPVPVQKDKSAELEPEEPSEPLPPPKPRKTPLKGGLGGSGGAAFGLKF